MIHKVCYLLVGFLLCSTMASAQVTFEQKYSEGSKYVTNREAKSTQTLTLAGMGLDTKSLTFIVSTTNVGKRTADGLLKIEEKIDSLQSDISLPGGLSLQFDSANPDKKASIPQLEPILEVLRAVYQFPVTVELDSKSKIVSVKLPEGELEKLPDAAKERLSPETLKKATEQAQAALPDGTVKKGDKWERASETNIGGGQLLSFRTGYEYVGPVEKDGSTLDKISGKAIDVNYTVNGNAALQVTKSDLKVIESEITILFHRELQTVISRTSKTRIAGPLTLVINNMELPGNVDLTIEENSTRQK